MKAAVKRVFRIGARKDVADLQLLRGVEFIQPELDRPPQVAIAFDRAARRGEV